MPARQTGSGKRSYAGRGAAQASPWVGAHAWRCPRDSEAHARLGTTGDSSKHVLQCMTQET